MSDTMTPAERADLIRSLFRHRGWTEMQSPSIRAKMDQMKDQLLLEPEQRQPDIKNWSVDKFAGFVLGLGWGNQFLADWLTRYDANINQQAVAEEEAAEPAGTGHPYGNSHAEVD